MAFQLLLAVMQQSLRRCKIGLSEQIFHKVKWMSLHEQKRPICARITYKYVLRDTSTVWLQAQPILNFLTYRSLDGIYWLFLFTTLSASLLNVLLVIAVHKFRSMF